jgi:hypothetical protein
MQSMYFRDMMTTTTMMMGRTGTGTEGFTRR